MTECPEVAAILVLDSEGSRIACKYFSRAYSDLLAQTEFEKKLYKKTKSAPAKVDADVLLLDGLTVVYRAGGAADLNIFVAGASDENELILSSVLDALTAAMSELLKGQLDKRSVMMQLELLLLCMDELVDGGTPLELDPGVIVGRVLLRGAVPESISSYNELTVGALMDRARDKLAKQFVK